MSSNNIAPIESKKEFYPIGIANIVVPTGIDRAAYINNCFKTSTVSIFSSTLGWVNRVPVDKMSLNFIEFPKESSEFGSSICYVVDQIHKKPLIIGIFNNLKSLADLEEGSFNFRRSENDSLIEIAGSLNNGSITLNTINKEGSKIILNASSSEEGSEVQIKSDGNIELDALHETKILSHSRFISVTKNRESEIGASFEQTEENNVFTGKEFEIHAEKIKINDGDQPFVLGNTLKDLMNELIDEIGKSTVSTGIGQMPLLNAQQIVAFKERIAKILSKKAFLDE